MPARWRFIVAVIAVFIFGVTSVTPIFSAGVVINEFSSNTSPDWVELFNTSDSSIDLTNYTLIDNSSSGNLKSFSCTLAPKGFAVVDWSNKLNNAGDTIHLKVGNEVVDCISYGDGNGATCPGKDAVDLETPNSNQVSTRSTDGGDWLISDSSTKDSPNDGSQKLAGAVCAEPTPTPTPTPTKTPKSTSTPKPTSLASQTPEPTIEATGVVAGVSLGIKSSPSTFSSDLEIGDIVEATPSSDSASEATPSSDTKTSGKFTPFAIAGGGILALAAIAPIILKKYNKDLWQKLFKKKSSVGDPPSSGQE